MDQNNRIGQPGGNTPLSGAQNNNQNPAQVPINNSTPAQVQSAQPAVVNPTPTVQPQQAPVMQQPAQAQTTIAQAMSDLTNDEEQPIAAITSTPDENTDESELASSANPFGRSRANRIASASRANVAANTITANSNAPDFFKNAMQQTAASSEPVKTGMSTSAKKAIKIGVISICAIAIVAIACIVGFNVAKSVPTKQNTFAAFYTYLVNGNDDPIEGEVKTLYGTSFIEGTADVGDEPNDEQTAYLAELDARFEKMKEAAKGSSELSDKIAKYEKIYRSYRAYISFESYFAEVKKEGAKLSDRDKLINKVEDDIAIDFEDERLNTITISYREYAELFVDAYLYFSELDCIDKDGHFDTFCSEDKNGDNVGYNDFQSMVARISTSIYGDYAKQYFTDCMIKETQELKEIMEK